MTGERRGHHHDDPQQHQRYKHHYTHPYHYVSDAALLLDQCLQELLPILQQQQNQEQTKGPICPSGASCCLDALMETLLNTKRMLLQHVCTILNSFHCANKDARAAVACSCPQEHFVEKTSLSCASLSDAVARLKSLTVAAQNDKNAMNLKENHIHGSSNEDKENNYFHGCAQHGNCHETMNATCCSSQHDWVNDPSLPLGRSLTNTRLFRLIVILQLCLVRIDDARYAITGHRGQQAKQQQKKQREDMKCNDNNTNSDRSSSASMVVPISKGGERWLTTAVILGIGGLAAVSATMASMLLQRNHRVRLLYKNATYCRISSSIVSFARTSVKVGLSAWTTKWLHATYKKMWMKDKIVKSTKEISQWNCAWQQEELYETVHSKTSESLFPPFWNGDELRWFFLRHTMNSLYASVETATRVAQKHSKPSNRNNPLANVMTAAVASMLDGSAWAAPAITLGSSNSGMLARRPPTKATASSRCSEISPASQPSRANDASLMILQHAWGITSSAVLQNISIGASRLLKGAAIVDRIELAGVKCFVCSRQEIRELTAAIQLYNRREQKRKQKQRQQQRRTYGRSAFLSLPAASFSKNRRALPTIDEDSEHDGFRAVDTRRGDGAGVARHSKAQGRDVILHLTGGGFFTHMIASDLPYLLDWSSAGTGAVVICPEYHLLPDHAFPAALNQVYHLYQALQSNHESVTNRLGFAVRRIILTGESSGGNLATALCVKMILSRMSEQPSEEKHEQSAGLLSVGARGSLKAQNNNSSIREQRNDSERDNDTLNRDGVDSVDFRSVLQQQGFHQHLDPTTMPASTQQRPCLPHALLLSCPMLDLSLSSPVGEEIYAQRQVPLGTNATSVDPVLPSGLIAAISSAYCRPLSTTETTTTTGATSGTRKQHPLVSPFYASDDVLRCFPPTLILTSSTDPFLDDAVTLNQRLKSLGVESDVKAGQNLPHAYLGLGTAGFPQAIHMQRQCQEWLANHQINHYKSA